MLRNLNQRASGRGIGPGHVEAPLQGRALRNLNRTAPARRILGTAFVGLLGATILANPPGPDGASILARQGLDPAARYRLVWGESTFASAWVEETGAAVLSVPGAAVFALFESGLPVAVPQDLRTVSVSAEGDLAPPGWGGGAGARWPATRSNRTAAAASRSSGLPSPPPRPAEPAAPARPPQQQLPPPSAGQSPAVAAPAAAAPASDFAQPVAAALGLLRELVDEVAGLRAEVARLASRLPAQATPIGVAEVPAIASSAADDAAAIAAIQFALNISESTA